MLLSGIPLIRFEKMPAFFSSKKVPLTLANKPLGSGIGQV